MSRGGYERLPMYASESSSRNRHSPRALHFNFPSVESITLPQTRRARSRTHSPQHSASFLKNRALWNLLKYALPSSLLLLLLGFYLYEPHVEFAFYSRTWTQKQIFTVPKLSGCFDDARVHSTYNVTDGLYGPRRTEVQAGMSLRFDDDCYNLAGTIQPLPRVSTGYIPPEQRTQYHTYWRNDLAVFGPRQEWMLKSFFATQHLPTSRLVLWSNGELGPNDILSKYLNRYPDSFSLRIVDIPSLARGTFLEGSDLLVSKDKKAWVDGDLIRLLLLWNFGGVWVDMDSLLTRDLEPLLEHEFVTQWDCYDKAYQPLNGALMRFKQHSPYLCEAFHIMGTADAPRAGSTDWGSLLYLKMYRSLLAGGIPPFKILPFCFTDARSCRLDNRLPDPFVADSSSGNRMGIWNGAMGENEKLDVALKKIFGIHLHNQWEKPFPEGGWVDRLLLKQFDRKLLGF
ncbi:Glycosyltransferase family 32 protein [Mycena chlorophos]|uniref:Glycosyltransferase family 32 protein n=1 Tax=Mycena chlorophos TaxID=658473 RepID=A0A8H6SBS7_MYCCL|nr:Glycosyltransferase family 32 protein [Mycena chlorophos]